MIILLSVLCILAGYLIGSLNFAIIVCRLTGKEDVRHFGSKNAGMTNMLRTYGKGPAILTLVGDVSKGILAILLCWLVFFLFGLDRPVWLDYAIGFSAMLGHSFPIFYGFKGGKGVMIAIGIILLLQPLPSLATLAVFLVVLAFSRIVSLSSITATISAPFWLWLYGAVTDMPNLTVKVLGTAVMALLIVVLHKDNILRLIRGEEHSFRSKKK